MFSSDLAIDLGTANTLVFAAGKGIVVNEPSIVAINKSTGEVEAVAPRPKRCWAALPATSWPSADEGWRDRRLQSHREDAQLLHPESAQPQELVHPRIVIGVPSEIRKWRSARVEDSALPRQASEVTLVEQAMVAAYRRGAADYRALGNMVVDIGGGTTDIAVISWSALSIRGRAHGRQPDGRGDHQLLKRKYNLLIGERTAEHVKIEIGSGLPAGQAADHGDQGAQPDRGRTQDDHGGRQQYPRGAGRVHRGHHDGYPRGPGALPAELSADITNRHRAHRRRRAHQESDKRHSRGDRFAGVVAADIAARWCWAQADAL